MALIKATKKTVNPPRDQERRHRERDRKGLIEALSKGTTVERRWAARDLQEFPDCVEILANRLPHEPEHVVREAILATLLFLGGEQVVAVLIPLLRSDDAALRNGVIEVLQNLPDEVAPHMRQLLEDPDSDIRIFAIDILQVLRHPSTLLWLMQVIEQEQHINVVGAAIDRLAEVGTPDMVPALEELKQRWPEQQFIHFAVDAAIHRIRGA